jgi:hypothetical protein
MSAWFLGEFVRDWRGDPEGADEHFTHAMRLSPLDPEMYRMQAGLVIARIFAGRFEEVRQAMTRPRELDPTLRPTNLTKYVPISRPQDVAIFAEGLRKAGLPD